MAKGIIKKNMSKFKVFFRKDVKSTHAYTSAWLRTTSEPKYMTEDEALWTKVKELLQNGKSSLVVTSEESRVPLAIIEGQVVCCPEWAKEVVDDLEKQDLVYQLKATQPQ